MSLRVLTFCDYFSEDSSGGSERVAREVASRLVRDHDAEVVLVGALPRTVAAQSISHERQGALPTALVPGHDLSRWIGLQLLVAPGLLGAAQRQIRAFAPDVLHAHSLHFQSTIVAAALARRHRIPLVTTAHLGGTGQLSGVVRTGAAGWDATIGRAILRASSGLVAVSDAVAAHLRRLGADPARITVAANGVDHEVFHARGRQDGLAELRITYVGRLIANKGPEILLDAYAAAVAAGLRGTLTLLGDGPLRGALQERVAAHGLLDRVNFRGHVQQVADHLRAADVVVRPSYTEGLPLAVIEAMACGAPVLCTDVPGNTELVDDGVSGLVVPVGDVAALSAALLRVDRDRDLLRRLRAASISAAAAYSWDLSAQRHADALRRVSSSERIYT